MAANRLALKIISCFAVITCAVFVVAYSHFSIGALEQGNPNGSILMGFAVLWLLLMVWSSPFVFMPEQQQGKEKQKRVPPAIPYSRLFGLEIGRAHV